MVRGLALVALACWAAAGSQAFLLPAGRPPTSTATCLRAAAAAAPQTVVAAAAEGSSTGGGSKAASQARSKGNTTLLNELRPGMRLHGGVVGVTDFAAFVDVQVVRKGAGGRLVRCNAVLHPNDLPDGYKLLRDGQPLPLENDPHVIRRGIHAQVWVKDVFPNSGRFSVTLDPTIDKTKVVKGRMQKRALGKKRNKIEPVKAELGDEMEGQVVKVLRRGLLIDVGLPVPAFLALSSIADEDTLLSACRQGRRMSVRVSEKTEKQIKCELLKLL